MTGKPKLWRPWKFSLRTLLTLTLAFACFFCGWTARDWELQRELERARQEERELDEKDFKELVDRVGAMIESAKGKQQEP